MKKEEVKVLRKCNSEPKRGREREMQGDEGTIKATKNLFRTEYCSSGSQRPR